MSEAVCATCHYRLSYPDSIAAGVCRDCRKDPPPARPRPSWDEYFFDMARLVSKRATCPRASIGCVIVSPLSHRVLATGYNGAPQDEPHCIDEGVGCLMFAGHCIRATHAEVNAARQVSGTQFDLDAYVVGPRPICSHCARELHAAGVREVKWRAS